MLLPMILSAFFELKWNDFTELCGKPGIISYIHAVYINELMLSDIHNKKYLNEMMKRESKWRVLIKQ